MESQRVDTVVINGKISTMRNPCDVVEAMAIANGTIVALGSTDDIRALAPHARVIDCRNRRVLPGFIDSHCHPDMHGARLGSWVDLSTGPFTRDELLRLIARRLEGADEGRWF